MTGLVYPDFDQCLVVPEDCPSPEGQRLVGGIDFGWRNPFAAVWGILDRDDTSGCWASRPDPDAPPRTPRRPQEARLGDVVRRPRRPNRDRGIAGRRSGGAPRRQRYPRGHQRHHRSAADGPAQGPRAGLSQPGARIRGCTATPASRSGPCWARTRSTATTTPWLLCAIWCPGWTHAFSPAFAAPRAVPAPKGRHPHNRPRMRPNRPNRASGRG